MNGRVEALRGLGEIQGSSDAYSPPWEAGEEREAFSDLYTREQYDGVAGWRRNGLSRKATNCLPILPALPWLPFSHCLSEVSQCASLPLLPPMIPP